MNVLLAGCVIVDDYGRILLLHRSSYRFTGWELPGGKVEDEEATEAAAVRELREELGVDVQLTGSFGSAEFEDDANDYIYDWFTAKIIAGQLTIMEPESFDEYDYFDLDDLMSLALSANMQVMLDKLYSGEVALGGY